MIHLNSTFGEDPKGKCAKCKANTMIFTCGHINLNHEGNDIDDMDAMPEIEEEISGHYCPECQKVTALFFNAKGAW